MSPLGACIFNARPSVGTLVERSRLARSRGHAPAPEALVEARSAIERPAHGGDAARVPRPDVLVEVRSLMEQLAHVLDAAGATRREEVPAGFSGAVVHERHEAVDAVRIVVGSFGAGDPFDLAFRSEFGVGVKDGRAVFGEERHRGNASPILWTFVHGPEPGRFDGRRWRITGSPRRWMST